MIKFFYPSETFLYCATIVGLIICILTLLWFTWRRDQAVFSELAIFVKQINAMKQKRSQQLNDCLTTLIAQDEEAKARIIPKLLAAEQHGYQKLIRIYADRNPKNFIRIIPVVEELLLDYLRAIECKQRVEDPRAQELLFGLFRKYRSLFELSTQDNDKLTLDMIEQFLKQEGN